MKGKESVYLWAKTSREEDDRWHPLILHMLDVACSADAILEREPESTRERMASILGLPWTEARPWLLLLIACHDLGKASPGFQSKWPELLALTELRLPINITVESRHAFVSQLALSELLQAQGWSEELAELVSDAVGCHHGSRAAQTEIENASLEIHVGRGVRPEAVRYDWIEVRRSIFSALSEVLQPGKAPAKKTLSGPDFMLLSGLASFADWIGSNEDWFTFGTPNDCDDLPSWFKRRRAVADKSLDFIGWAFRIPLASEPRNFQQVFGFAPRPMQQAVADVLDGIKVPSILLIEAPMGEGKTEAAFFACLETQRRFNHRGFYVALPTKATGNAMFKRSLEFLRKQRKDRHLDLQLLHGGALLNETYQDLKVTGIFDPDNSGDVRAGEWFTNKKRALLSEYGVGTVDQALLTILPVRHQFVRLWGLANRVVIFDEIHAYDAYTGTLLTHMLRWLLALGSSVVLLSATLTPTVRRSLAAVTESRLSQPEKPYPRISVFCPNDDVKQTHFEADPARHLSVQMHGIEPDLSVMQAELIERLVDGGFGLVLVNTVQRAQDLYRLFPAGEPLEREGLRVGKRLSDGTEVYFFHARFPADRRQVRENQVLESFGAGASRSGRKILIATQVVEQSLDLDFDLIVTDLAPVDLLLQRAGRLWRHAAASRPVSSPMLLVAGLVGSEPPSFAKPLWWGSIYREDILLRTWSLLRGKQQLNLPDEIDVLVQAVYEEQVDVPEYLVGRLNSAMLNSDGNIIAHTVQAHQAIIGRPDDASWNDPARFVLYDEDEPGVHRTLMAQTRLGEDSVVVIPLWMSDGFLPEAIPNFAQAKQWFLRSVRLTRKGVVMKLKASGVPEGWKKSSLLRNCFPLILDENNRWTEDMTVRLDDDLGLVYEKKEVI